MFALCKYYVCAYVRVVHICKVDVGFFFCRPFSLSFSLKGRDPALANFARYAHTPQELNTLIQVEKEYFDI